MTWGSEVPSVFASGRRNRGNILATNADDETRGDALDARENTRNTGQNGAPQAVPGEPIPLSRR